MTALTERAAPVSGAGVRRRGVRGWSTLQKSLIGVAFVYLGVVPIFWFLEERGGVSHGIATNTMTVIHVLCFVTALSLPWVLRQKRALPRSQRFDAMVIVWVFIALTPRFIWELPWLLFLPAIKRGVLHGQLWSYMWSPYLLGGDNRYLNGDPLIKSLEWIALFVGVFELYAIVQFFRHGKRFTTNQLAFIMGGMIVEVMLPAVYFLTDILGKSSSSASAADLWIKFVLLNSFWCTMPFLTYFWGVRRLVRQDLEVPSF